MRANTIEVEINDDIAVLTLNRVKQKNALNTEMLLELRALLQKLGPQSEIRCIVITGNKDTHAFASGADVFEMASMEEKQAAVFSKLGCETFDLLEQTEKPVIAAINGYALGGGLELALACDVRIAAMDAMVGLPETTLGIMPGFEGAQRLMQLAGYAKAAELVFSGRMITAQEARDAGIVNACFEQGQFWEKTLGIAHAFCRNAPLAVAAAKKVMKSPHDTAVNIALFGKLFETEDQKTGMNNMLHKQKTEYFKGK